MKKREEKLGQNGQLKVMGKEQGERREEERDKEKEEKGRARKIRNSSFPV